MFSLFNMTRGSCFGDKVANDSPFRNGNSREMEHQQRILGQKSVRSSDINVPSKRIKRDDEVCFADLLNLHCSARQKLSVKLMYQETFLFNTTMFQ